MPDVMLPSLPPLSPSATIMSLSFRVTIPPETKLWELDVHQPLTLHANAAIGSATATDLVAFAHAALFSPALSTLEEALLWGHVPEFASLTLQSFRKHAPFLKPVSRVT